MRSNTLLSHGSTRKYTERIHCKDPGGTRMGHATGGKRRGPADTGDKGTDLSLSPPHSALLTGLGVIIFLYLPIIDPPTPKSL